MADLEPLRAGMEQAVPFNGHLGLEIVEVAVGRGVARLPDNEALRNHTGSQHASALFALGQAASGAAFAATFVRDLPALELAPDAATINYKKIPRGVLTATGVLGSDPQELHDELEREGAVSFSVDVSITDGAGDVVADMTVRWNVRKES
jgi:acyl-coenzyme A thioesterase PaaI-like protein